MRTVVCISVVGGLVLTACASGPNYVRPTTPISAAYKEAVAPTEGWMQAVPADAVDRRDWWRVFNDPILDALQQRLEVSNQNLAAAEAAYRQARALVREQRAAYFPTVLLEGSGQRAKAASLGGGASTANAYRFDIGGTWAPDVWGAVRRAVEAAGALAQASAGDLAAAKLSAQGELAANYLQLREADAEIALVAATVDGYARSLQITSNRYDARIAARSDVLLAETQLANAQASLSALTQQRAQAEHAIAVLIGQVPADFTLAVAPSWSQTAPDVPVELPSALLQRRPDIAAAERRVAAANAQIGVAEAAYFPVITLTGDYGGAASQLNRLFDASSSLWSLGVALAETVFDGGARRGRTEQARAAYDQAVAQYRQITLTAFRNVEDQLAATRILAQQNQHLAEASAAADAAEQISLNQYRAGLVAYTDVVVAQATALSARRALAQSVLTRQLAAVALIEALGGDFTAEPSS
ncbi:MULTISPECIES: efflux transporter outer membrane subunit [unclassified Brevundimonas]|uniref:efflux transporter outer membrane subunit n=1 Tax=unclassified Brevundimonas TaxID=2622653 RepID=UPI003F8E27DE